LKTTEKFGRNGLGRNFPQGQVAEGTRLPSNLLWEKVSDFNEAGSTPGLLWPMNNLDDHQPVEVGTS